LGKFEEFKAKFDPQFIKEKIINIEDHKLIIVMLVQEM
jgi:hypothetical protein